MSMEYRALDQLQFRALLVGNSETKRRDKKRFATEIESFNTQFSEVAIEYTDTKDT